MVTRRSTRMRARGCDGSTSVDLTAPRRASCPTGEQRQLELAITLATRPQIVLLDEPTAGMSHAETSVILELMAELLEGLTVVIVEHDLSVVDRLAHRVVVLERGQIICDGTPSEVKADTRVQSAYLRGAHRA
jgi:branched-chain amino acid transport system ATP-binding protein